MGKENRVGYRKVIKEKEFMKMLLANVINRFGDGVDSITIIWITYSVTKSASWSAIIYALNQLPTIFLQPIAGTITEYFDKKNIMYITDMIRGIIVIILLFLHMSGYMNIIIIVFFSITVSVIEAFRVPTGVAFIRKTINIEDYSFANSMNSTVCSIAQIVGLGLAGTIVGLFGVGGTMLIDAVTFFISALLIKSIKHKTIKNINEKLKREEKYRTLIKEGFIYVYKNKLIRNFCIMAIIVNAILVPINSLQVPLIIEELGGGSMTVSLLNTMLTIGIMFGTMLFPIFERKYTVRSLLLFSGYIIISIYFFMAISKFGKGNTLFIACVIFFTSLFIGMSVGIMSSCTASEFMKVVDEQYVTRSAAIFNSFGAVASPIMSSVIAILAYKFAVSNILILVSILGFLIFTFIVKKMKFEILLGE